jgi:hypothetical protein
MSISANEVARANAVRVTIGDESVLVELSDGRTITVPISWYPRLERASQSEREQWELIASGAGIRWPAVDEDISVEALLAGRRSSESDASLARWLNGRSV